MQPRGDLQNEWMMFDQVKHVKEWTTIACHVYDPQYKEVMTISTCNMQSKDMEIQVLFWKCLNAAMSQHKVDHPNFKGFMADSAMDN
jgi:hypothetical protein